MQNRTTKSDFFAAEICLDSDLNNFKDFILNRGKKWFKDDKPDLKKEELTFWINNARVESTISLRALNLKKHTLVEFGWLGAPSSSTSSATTSTSRSASASASRPASASASSKTVSKMTKTKLDENDFSRASSWIARTRRRNKL